MVWLLVAATTVALGFCMGWYVVRGWNERRVKTPLPSSEFACEEDDRNRLCQTFRVEATPRTVMDVLTSFLQYPEWIDDIRECTIYARTENERRVRIVTPVLWFTVETHLIHRITDDSVSWCLDTDHPTTMFRVNEGRWHVRAAEDGCSVVTHACYMEPTLPVPSNVIDLIKGEASRRAVEWVPRAVRTHSVTEVHDAERPWYTRCLAGVPGKNLLCEVKNRTHATGR